MTQSEKIDKILEVVSDMKGDMKVLSTHSAEHRKTLYGNGKPGVVSVLQSIEEQQRKCPALQEALLRPKNKVHAKANRIALAAIVVSTLVGLLSIAVAVFVALYA